MKATEQLMIVNHFIWWERNNNDNSTKVICAMLKSHYYHSQSFLERDSFSFFSYQYICVIKKVRAFLINYSLNDHSFLKTSDVLILQKEMQLECYF